MRGAEKCAAIPFGMAGSPNDSSGNQCRFRVGAQLRLGTIRCQSPVDNSWQGAERDLTVAGGIWETVFKVE